MSSRENDYPVSVREIRISDPCIMPDPVSKKYYIYSRFGAEIYAAGDGPSPGRIDAICSEDLINWSRPFKVFDADETGFWAKLDYWAPEGHVYNGRYYIISSFRAPGTYRRCQCLVSDTPEGPFRPIEPDPVTPEGWQCLDGSLYVDGEGKPWMVFCHEWTQVQDGQICIIPLSEDLGHAVGEAQVLFRASDAPWRDDRLGYMPEEGMTWISGFITDGCFAHRLDDGTLIMLWSNFCRHGYAVGYARSVSGEIQGPWVQEPVPLYVMDGGHAMIFRTFEGKKMMTFHAPNHPHDRKRMLLFDLEEIGNRLYLLNECTGNWFNIDKAREPIGYYTEDLNVPPVIGSK